MKWLTRGGIVAALAVGGATVWGVGWPGLVVLLAFLVSGSVLTAAAQGGGGRRTAAQVFANGGVAAVAAALGSWPLFVGAIAAATADTWATEIGSFSPSAPRLITTGAPVPRGASGGITALGTAAGTAGAGVVAVLAVLLEPRSVGWLAAVTTVAGVAGMVVDSVLGATVQGTFSHEPLQPARGYRWVDNDVVNLGATLTGAGVAALGWWICC